MNSPMSTMPINWLLKLLSFIRSYSIAIIATLLLYSGIMSALVLNNWSQDYEAFVAKIHAGSFGALGDLGSLVDTEADFYTLDLEPIRREIERGLAESVYPASYRIYDIYINKECIDTILISNDSAAPHLQHVILVSYNIRSKHTAIY